MRILLLCEGNAEYLIMDILLKNNLVENIVEYKRTNKKRTKDEYYLADLLK